MEVPTYQNPDEDRVEIPVQAYSGDTIPEMLVTIDYAGVANPIQQVVVAMIKTFLQGGGIKVIQRSLD